MIIKEFVTKSQLAKVTNGHQHNVDDSVLNDKIYKFIKEKCSDFLNAGVLKTKKLLYRGINNSREPAFIGSNREFRKSVTRGSKAANAQELCDAYLKTAGFSALRSNSVFCNPDFERVEAFGNTYAVFPLNGFKYTYAASSTNNTALYSYEYPDEIVSLAEAPGDSDDFQRYAKIFVKNNGFENSRDLRFALINDCDVWFTGQFVALSVGFETGAFDVPDILRNLSK